MEQWLAIEPAIVMSRTGAAWSSGWGWGWGWGAAAMFLRSFEVIWQLTAGDRYSATDAPHIRGKGEGVRYFFLF